MKRSTQETILKTLVLLQELDPEKYPDNAIKECSYWLISILLSSYRKEDTKAVSRLIAITYKQL